MSDIQWRALEVEQITLDHARDLWDRHAQQTRQDADDRADQLKGLARLSVIIAGFSMSSFLEFNFDASTVSTGVLIAYGVTTSLVAAIYTGCSIHCNLILGNVLQLSASFLTPEEERNFLWQCREFAIRYHIGAAPPAPVRSFRKMWEFRCSSSWRQCLVLFAFGVPVFLVNMAISGWIKFIMYKPAAVVMTVIMSLTLAALTITFFRLVSHLIGSKDSTSQAVNSDANPQRLPWSWHRQPVAYKQSEKLQYTGPVLRHVKPQQAPGSLQFMPTLDGRDCTTALWRQEDLEQQHLENALVLWNRLARKIQSSSEEKAEQMRELSFLAGILLSFGMAALYQLVYDVSTHYNGVKLMYSLTIALTVSCMLSAMTACGFLNMAVVKSAAQILSAENQAKYLQSCRLALHRLNKFKPPSQAGLQHLPDEDKLQRDFNICSALFTAGSIIFQLCLIFSAWLKFAPQLSDSLFGPRDHSGAAITMTVVLSLGIIYTITVTIAWAKGPSNPSQQSALRQDVPSVGLPFDWHLSSEEVEQHLDKPDTQLPNGKEQAKLLPFRASADSLYAALNMPTESSLIGSARPNVPEEWSQSLRQERDLRSAVQLWQKFCSRNLNDLEEKQEQLTAVTDLAAVIAGFEMIAFLQFQFDTTQIAPGLQIAYTVTSGLTVALMVFAMVICGVMLLSLIESSKEFTGLAQEADFIARCCTFAERFSLGDKPPIPKTSLAKHWELRCEKDWRWAFYMFSLGIPCFLANAAVTTWIKFQGNNAPAIVVTVLSGLAVLYLVTSHARWVKHILGKPFSNVPQAVYIGDQGLPNAWYVQGNTLS